MLFSARGKWHREWNYGAIKPRKTHQNLTFLGTHESRNPVKYVCCLMISEGYGKVACARRFQLTAKTCAIESSRFEKKSGGERGIRTPGTVSGSVVFKTTAIDHSAISPRFGGP